MSCEKHPKYKGLRSPRGPILADGSRNLCEGCLAFRMERLTSGVKETRKQKMAVLVEETPAVT